MPWYYFEFLNEEMQEIQHGYIHSTNILQAKKRVGILANTDDFMIQLHHSMPEEIGIDEEE